MCHLKQIDLLSLPRGLDEERKKMTPFTKLEEELAGMTHEQLVGHIRWLYAYIEEIKHELRRRPAC